MLKKYRDKIDNLDKEITQLLADRMKIVEKIGEHKKNIGKEILDMNRYDEMLRTRQELAKELGLEEELVRRLFDLVHEFSVKRQK